MNCFNEEILTGTTIIAIKTKTCVIIGADSRTSSGSFIPSRHTNKLTELTPNIFCLRSGSAADTRMISDFVSDDLSEFTYKYETKPTVKVAASLCREIIYNDSELQAAIIIAGCDTDGPSIYNIKIGGSMVKNDYAIGGSGSIFMYSIMDTEFKVFDSEEEGVQFVEKAIRCAIKRDNASGGGIRIGIIREDGIERRYIPGNEISVI